MATTMQKKKDDRSYADELNIDIGVYDNGDSSDEDVSPKIQKPINCHQHQGDLCVIKLLIRSFRGRK